MDRSYTYLLVDFFCLIFPLLFSFHPKIRFYKQWRFFSIPALITATIFITWDLIFTDMGVWGFNEKYVCGIYFYKLPIEELLFFICIPYACVFTYYCIDQWMQGKKRPVLLSYIPLGLAILLFVIAVFNFQKWYTVTSLAFCSLLLLLNYKKHWMPIFLLTFVLILIPFFISNGILTGTWIDEPVVWYNNEENLRIRLASIPVEDTFYGMAMLLMNVAGFEWFKKKWTK
jgi:lycopene cyclase domain-containing protein